jgi:hypothetical protein
MFGSSCFAQALFAGLPLIVQTINPGVATGLAGTVSAATPQP